MIAVCRWRLTPRSPCRVPERKGGGRSHAQTEDTRDWRARSEPVRFPFLGDGPVCFWCHRQRRDEVLTLCLSRQSSLPGADDKPGRRGGGRGGPRNDVDRTPLPPGEAGAEIVKAANPWTRAGPADEMERLARQVKGCVRLRNCKAHVVSAPPHKSLETSAFAHARAPLHPRSILNKVTPEKFERLMEQLLVRIRRPPSLVPCVARIRSRAVAHLPHSELRPASTACNSPAPHGSLLLVLV